MNTLRNATPLYYFQGIAIDYFSVFYSPIFIVNINVIPKKRVFEIGISILPKYIGNKLAIIFDEWYDFWIW